MNNNFNNAGYQTGSNYGRGPQDNTMMQDRNYTMVTSLQEALSKQAPLNSIGLYVHQDGEYEFEVFTDYIGRKNYKVYKRSDCTTEQNEVQMSKNDYNELKEKINKLEDVVYGRSTSDAKSGPAEM